MSLYSKRWGLAACGVLFWFAGMCVIVLGGHEPQPQATPVPECTEPYPILFQRKRDATAWCGALVQWFDQRALVEGIDGRLVMVHKGEIK